MNDRHEPINEEKVTQELQTATEQLNKLELPDEVKNLALAELCLECGQYAQAIEQLEGIVNVENQTVTRRSNKDEARRLLQEIKTEYKGDGKQSSQVEERLRNLVSGQQIFFECKGCGCCTTDNGRRGRWIRSLSQRKWICFPC